MPIIRRKLEPATVYPTDLRYNIDTDTVQSKVNGSWVDNPAADPRRQTTLPPRITSNPACDAAQSVTDALKNQLDATIEAIDNSSTAFTIAGLILSLFSFGVFAVFIDLALFIVDQMVAAGASALRAALTGATYDTLTCILFCEFGTDGRLKAGGLDTAMSEITGQIGGLAATVLNAMLRLAGEGGVNNLASLGTSTGSCSDCGCHICNMDLWTHVGLGTEVERGDNYVVIEAANIPGAFGNWRAEIDTTDFNVCCPVNEWAYTSGPPDFPTYKSIPCGRPFVDESSYDHGIPTVGTEKWAIGIDAATPFTIRFNFL